MFKLMKLELKKHSLGWYWKGAIVSTLAIVLIMGILPFTEEEAALMFDSYEEVFFALGIMVRAVFIVFAAVLLSSFLIQEYNHKTISVLFTYPVPRKKLIAAKILLIMGITIFAMLACNVLVIVLFLIANEFLLIIPGTPSAELLASEGVEMLILALSAMGISLVPLYFGMRKKSVAATILTAVILISLTSSNNGGISLSQYIAVPVVLGIIGLTIAWLSFKNVDELDVA